MERSTQQACDKISTDDGSSLKFSRRIIGERSHGHLDGITRIVGNGITITITYRDGEIAQTLAEGLDFFIGEPVLIHLNTAKRKRMHNNTKVMPRRRILENLTFYQKIRERLSQSPGVPRIHWHFQELSLWRDARSIRRKIHTFRHFSAVEPVNVVTL